MSSVHLGAGSEKPAEVKGQARLYSMKFCPFAHRIRLILSYKKIPHDIVNINLKNKPEWYFEIHPEDKVPAFVDTDGTVIVDSIVIANYLDEKYPEPPLYNETTRARDLELLDHYSKIVTIFSNCIHGNDKRPLSEIIAEVSNLLGEFEEELKTRGTTFFGGIQPGIVDILMWPWVERRKALALIYKESMNFNAANFTHIMEWVQEMKAQPFVQENECSHEKFAKLIEDMNAGNVDYDNL
ncbi:PREDICTED: pyrimidodiazepine synthase-like [Dufourea novaeangliae]|uniref:Glutathione-dependent dehydroascorbate reductase n=1 Tax=Dufourea novaeangliae TaxID=178035 RepID=A0A154PLJ8_DUFNO|nr:PREDICTED: pyrimidodiazepine synthase-like [Dufourea novaeangliae]KZC12100.1 Glutathione S-transferase omega-1 [Dufourea novaeangliae]